LSERSPQPCQGLVALGETDPVDGQVVDQPRVEHVLDIAPIAHTGRRLLGQPQERAEDAHVFAEHRFVPQIRRHFGELGQELAHGHRRSG